MAVPELSQLGFDETCMNDPKVIVALDYPDPEQALEFSRKVKPEQCRLKVGKELFTSAGPTLVEAIDTEAVHAYIARSPGGPDPAGGGRSPHRPASRPRGSVS